MKARERMVEGEHWEQAFKLARELGRELRFVEAWTPDQVCKSFVGRKRTLYEKAFGRIADNGYEFQKWWANVLAFVKVEKYTFYDKIDRIPRPIQPRTMEYRAELSRYIKPIEGFMKKQILPGCHYPFLAKGQNSAELAKRFLLMWERFANPVALSLDLSKFDGTIHPKLKQLENSYFRQMSSDSNFQKMLDVQEEDEYEPRFQKFGQEALPCKPGKTKSGRCSGDPQTGRGNSIIMAIACRIILSGLDIELFVNGDDTIIIMDAEDLDGAMALVLSGFIKFGLDIKIEGVAREIEDVEWCQSRLCETPVGWRWVRNYQRVLNTIFSNVEYRPHTAKGLCAQIADAELSQNPGVPIIAPVCEWIVNNWKKTHKFAFEHDTLSRVSQDKCTIPDPKMRKWFTELTGIGPAEQERIEQSLISELKMVNFDKNEYRGWDNIDHPFGFGN